jgi:gamma-glutamylcyclotransferase (GGCT)/AIG2-like uncharacterized protein YtfP
MSQLVFVYGTLLSGCGNHRLLAHGDVIAHGPATCSGLTMFVTHGGFPYCTAEAHPGWKHVAVQGEVYEVNDHRLEHLDALEGVPFHYQRTAHTVNLLNSTERTAWVYTVRNIPPTARPIGHSWHQWRAHHDQDFFARYIDEVRGA